MLTHRSRLDLPELGRLPLQILLVVAHLRDGQGVGAVLIQRDPVRLKEVVSHPDHLLDQSTAGDVKRVLETDALALFIQGHGERV